MQKQLMEYQKCPLRLVRQKVRRRDNVKGTVECTMIEKLQENGGLQFQKNTIKRDSLSDRETYTQTGKRQRDRLIDRQTDKLRHI